MGESQHVYSLDALNATNYIWLAENVFLPNTSVPINIVSTVNYVIFRDLKCVNGVV